MPTLEIKTNVPIADVNAFASQFSQEAARILDKPEAVFSILVTPVPTMLFAGTPDPTFSMAVTCLDTLSPEKNLLYSKELFAFVEKALGIKNDRGYITFLDPGRSNLGLHSTTFASMFGDN
ncbi:Tautomerase/MIF [Guyanagaster necrorhizus]|uniref:L-dopachrome isomerase n=1 Tax=Guyanagaster necrorhizus TaxID=856835 RepID=A0A9P8AYL5_9AGAR|nr:Tautomerase/MIF [Guyanagaster necrorhizus MCA 3950]KAG7453019.1 Tautomerase/MIF [Guyanagaster necrorhizus MCA 3950]